ncbi:unnamed protein product [Angiostrongylus costaricensis]|uniref:Neur_chan_LBD domain-containing protein n=1 Tax=Angiostrongylus costaricensis TaxID=334426 RepID=A0A0R3PUU0_ANGCS|nr:unnamed protein product [Angiostrongylus costaricensis]
MVIEACELDISRSQLEVDLYHNLLVAAFTPGTVQNRDENQNCDILASLWPVDHTKCHCCLMSDKRNIAGARITVLVEKTNGIP